MSLDTTKINKSITLNIIDLNHNEIRFIKQVLVRTHQFEAASTIRELEKLDEYLIELTK